MLTRHTHPASALSAPRFFQVDATTLQTGLEERIRDIVHSSVSPLIASNWMEEFRALVEVAVSSSCFILGLVSSRSEQALGFAVNYGDRIYNMRYVRVPYSATSLRQKGLLIRLLVRFVLINVLPVISRLLQRRYLQREQQNALLVSVRFIEKILRLLDLINHCEFLFSGQYRHVIDRMLGVRLALGERELQLSAHTYLIDRQHFWSTVFAALSLFVPMLNIGSWLAYFGTSIRRLIAAFSATSTGGGNTGGSGATTPNVTGTPRSGSSPPSASGTGRQNRNQQNQSSPVQESFECLVCHSEPMSMPRKSKECGHVCVCYYCSSTPSSKPTECPQCHAFCSDFIPI